MTMTRVLALLLSLLAVPAAAADAVQTVHQGQVLNDLWAPAAAGDDTTVLLVHDSLSHAADPTMTALRRALAARGMAVLAITLSLGLDDRRGTYDCARPHRHRHDDAIGEIAAWLAWLEQRKAGPVTLLGHGRGGNQVAWFLATRAAPRVADAVLLGPPTWDLERAADAYKAQHGRALFAVLGPIMLMVKQGQGASHVTDVPFLDCPRATVAAKPFLTYYSDDEFLDTPNLLARIDKPVLVLWGADDATVGDLAEKMRRLERPRTGTGVLAGTGHHLDDAAARRRSGGKTPSPLNSVLCRGPDP